VKFLRFGAFIRKVQQHIQNTPEIDIKTVKIIMDEFEKCLTPDKRIRWSLELYNIKTYKSE
jgi:hypothetical protein